MIYFLFLITYIFSLLLGWCVTLDINNNFICFVRRYFLYKNLTFILFIYLIIKIIIHNVIIMKENNFLSKKR